MKTRAVVETYFAFGMDDVETHLSVYSQQGFFAYNFFSIKRSGCARLVHDRLLLREFALTPCHIFFFYHTAQKLFG